MNPPVATAGGAAIVAADSMRHPCRAAPPRSSALEAGRSAHTSARASNAAAGSYSRLLHELDASGIPAHLNRATSHTGVFTRLEPRPGASTF